MQITTEKMRKRETARFPLRFLENTIAKHETAPANNIGFMKTMFSLKYVISISESVIIKSNSVPSTPNISESIP